MTYEQFYNRARQIYFEPTFDVHQMSYYFGMLFDEYDAAQNSVQADGVYCVCENPDVYINRICQICGKPHALRKQPRQDVCPSCGAVWQPFHVVMSPDLCSICGKERKLP